MPSPCPPPRVDLSADLPIIHVAAIALVDPDGRVLMAQRPEGKAMAGLWEFPGGKVEPGELYEAALIRECREELAITVGAGCLTPFTFASHSYPDFHLFMPLYLCRNWAGPVRPQEGQTIQWLRPNAMKNLPMPEADRPLVAMLRDWL
ncbi:(deoxy)nucleoside triphosphate pyrophosphohydrolase [Yunchengibacter salinarum]|uniref:(deoxy)nucleoside triphosphate pyrophosphohydrolase n=1 Tax=Yunchengibacter salinarum TaxID=3133399 RepID=UPI0035B60621